MSGGEPPSRVAWCVACARSAGAHLMRVAHQRAVASRAQYASDSNLSRGRCVFGWPLFRAGRLRL